MEHKSTTVKLAVVFLHKHADIKDAELSPTISDQISAQAELKSMNMHCCGGMQDRQYSNKHLIGKTKPADPVLLVYIEQGIKEYSKVLTRAFHNTFQASNSLY